jgi:hypothetical protein
MIGLPTPVYFSQAVLIFRIPARILISLDPRLASAKFILNQEYPVRQLKNAECIDT